MTDARPLISVFGSSRCNGGEEQYETALLLGRSLAEAGFAVCSGGYGGIMEAVSRGAREAGSHTVGITCSVFGKTVNPWVVQEIPRDTWHDRMFSLLELGAGYVFLPGGTGTLVELAAAWEMLNKRLIEHRPAVVLGSFWAPMIEAVRAVEEHPENPWRESEGPLLYSTGDVADTVRYLTGGLATGTGV